MNILIVLKLMNKQNKLTGHLFQVHNVDTLLTNTKYVIIITSHTVLCLYSDVGCTEKAQMPSYHSILLHTLLIHENIHLHPQYNLYLVDFYYYCDIKHTISLHTSLRSLLLLYKYNNNNIPVIDFLGYKIYNERKCC